MDQAIDQQTLLLDLIKKKGPVIPSQVSSEIRRDLIITSAMLSDLVSKAKLRMTSLKVGSSPLYYLPGQEEMLQQFSSNMHEKAFRAFELLKKERILKDSKVEPVIRVALREIKDFAYPLDVTVENTKELYWKWYLVPKEEAVELIKSQLVPEAPEEPLQKKAPVPIQETLAKEPKPKQPPQADFAYQTESYFSRQGISVKSKEIIRKSREVDYVITVPSKMGDVRFYCKSKNKKLCNDADLSSVIVQAQLKRLPGLLMTNGKLSKKAQEFLEKNPGALTVKII